MKKQPSYLDVNLTPEERAKDLVSRMTLEEKASQLKYDAPAIKSLGVPYYNWWNEALHGVARAGTATIFPQAIGLAAMFDDEFLGEIADIIATEGRAKYNEQSQNGDGDIYKGITFWSPNINIFRDPRWGRGHETYGEDPYLTSRLGVAFVKGLQGDGKHLKGAACAKHFAVHSGPEGERHSFDAIVTDKDLWETYLPAFEALVKEADVEAVMGAYNAVGGEPCCGSKTLLKDILRDKWGFKGHVVSDCWAIRDFHTNHMVTSTAPESAALALKNGCDLNCGNTYLHLLQAYEQGLITEEDITRSTERLMTTRIKLGMFDDTCEYDSIPYTLNDCKDHHEASLEAARKSVVLLKNDGILPLDKDKLKTIAVIGPNANSRAILKANYCGTASRYITLLEGIQNSVGESTRVLYSEGCHLYKDRVEPLAFANDRMSEALSVARLSDVVVLCLGLDADLEGEEGDTGNSYAAGDKPDLKLPGLQQKLLEKVTELGKPVIVLLSSGSALAVDYAHENCSAVLQVWYPGALGGQAVAELLFGKYSPSGKLPVTFYKETNELPDFTDYSMKNRTYRYIESEPLYPFGYGLTYGDIVISDVKTDKDEVKEGENIKLSVEVTNRSDYDLEEVVQVYIKIKDSNFEVLNHRLCAFKRVKLEKGQTKTINLEVKNDSIKVIDDKGNKVLDGSTAAIYVGTSQPDGRSKMLTQKEVFCMELPIQL
ncbi:MAG: glycoside hydrolase family 3 protein [Clostridia bacterium]|jgi:beta-glucosidase|nr:glycoside hydrolase family 3 protein [Clostridia bacterium]